MMENLRRLAVSDQQLRRQAILEILNEMNCPFTIYQDKVGRHHPENIVVSFGEKSPRLIIGAHYDSVPGSTGANDNGAAVCILLDIIRQLLEEGRSFPIDFVFFDLEEGLTAGSEAFITRFPAHQFLGMINLDLCGVGDTIIISTAQNAEAKPFRKGIEKLKDIYPIAFVEEHMSGDNIPFEFAGIPNISISALPKDEIEATIKVWSAMLRHRAPDYIPPIFETMHNGKRDSVDVINVDMVSMIRRVLFDLIHEIDYSS